MSERTGSDPRATLDYFQPVDPFEDTWGAVDDLCVRTVMIVGTVFVLIALASLLFA
jgi:hypothetical protein